MMQQFIVTPREGLEKWIFPPVLSLAMIEAVAWLLQSIRSTTGKPHKYYAPWIDDLGMDGRMDIRLDDDERFDQKFHKGV